MKVENVIIIFLVVGTAVLAIDDERAKVAFTDLAKIGVGGYLGMLLPGQIRRE